MSKRVRKQNKNSQVSPPNIQIFRHTAIASAIAVAIAPINVAAGTWGTGKWGRNIEIFALPTTERVLVGSQLLEPIFQNTDSLTYLDLRAVIDPSDTEEFNIGIGHRLFYNRNWLLGGLFSFDTRNSARDKQHNQVTFGLEALSVKWDANFNYYLPTSDPKVVGLGTGGGTFQGNSFFANGVVEEGLEGFDVEVGTLLPFVAYGETRLYVGGYYFYGDVAPSTGTGVKARLEFRPRKDINLAFGVQDDHLFGTEAMFQIKYSFGYPKESGVRTLDERMIQFHERDIDVKDTGPVDDILMESGDPAHRQVVFSGNVVHIDNVTGSATGDGSFENPYDSFASCIGQSCDTNSTLVYVGAGGGTVTTYDTTTFQMADGQTLLGRGVELFGFGGDAFPTLTAGGNVIQLANNNEVAGLAIDAAGTQGIYGFNVTGFNIHDNRITNSARNGVALFFDETGPTSVTGTISNNTITGNARNGVYVYTNISDSFGSGATFNQDFTIANNTISNNGRDGIRINTDKIENDSGTALIFNQKLAISGNTIKDNAGDGIYINNYVYHDDGAGSSTINQIVDISNNTIADNGDNGIHVYNETGSEASVLNQTLSITNNTITGNTSDGVYIDFYNDYFSTINFIGNISNNTITGNGDDGIDINFDTYAYGVHDLDITIDNNNISSNTDNGIEIYLDNAYGYYNGGSRDVVTITNNTISNNGADGIYIDSFTTSYGILNQVVTISGNTINNNTDNGIQIYNYTTSYGVLNQTVVLSNNTIQNNGANGVGLGHNGRYNSVGPTYGSTQNVTFTGNTITGNGTYDVAIYNLSNTYSIQNVSSGGGNTIGSIYVDGDGTQSVTLP